MIVSRLTGIEDTMKGKIGSLTEFGLTAVLISVAIFAAYTALFVNSVAIRTAVASWLILP